MIGGVSVWLALPLVGLGFLLGALAVSLYVRQYIRTLRNSNHKLWEALREATEFARRRAPR